MRQPDVLMLRERGFRITRQRQLILDVLRQHGGHISAEAVYAEVERRHPTIDRATVYRTLNWLHAAGLAHKLTVSAERHLYEYVTTEPHHHLICSECGTETTIDHHVIKGLQEHILHHYNFEADPEHIAIFGRCAECRAAVQAIT